MGISRDVLEKYVVLSGEQWGTGHRSKSWRRAKPAMRLSEPGGPCWSDWAWAAKTWPRWRTGFLRDMRALLPTLPMPTLVLHREGNHFIRVEAGRYLAEHIPGATYVELPGADHPIFVGDVDVLA